MKALTERKVKPMEAERYLWHVFSDANKPIASNERAIAKALSLFDGQGKGADLASAKGTAFGLLNAVTEFIDHERRAKSVDHRLESAWFGQGATIKQKAFDQALLMVA